LVPPVAVFATGEGNFATSSPSAAIGCQRNWNESAVPQISAPEPSMLKEVGPQFDAPPKPGVPISAAFHVLQGGDDGDENSSPSPPRCTYESPTMRYAPALMMPPPATEVLNSGVPLWSLVAHAVIVPVMVNGVEND
jgi:hypothetical protein